MSTWEGITPEEVKDLEVGTELMVVPTGTSESGSIGLHFAPYHQFEYQEDTSLDFKKNYYLARVN